MSTFKKRKKEKILLEQACQGSEEAMSQLMEMYRGTVFRYCCYLTKNTFTAEDICQEVFVKGFQKIHQLNEGTSFKSWLLKIARNIYIDHIRLKKNQKHKNFDDLPEESIEPKNVLLKNTLQDVLSKLHPEEKQAILLIDVAGYSYEEAARMIEIPLKSLRWRIREGRRQFIELFKKENVEVTGIFAINSPDEEIA